MRALILGLLVSLLFSSPATAAQGYIGNIKTTIAISDSFFRALDPGGQMHLSAKNFTIPPVTGVLYVSGRKMRLDMNAPTGTMTTLTDGTGTAYMLDHKQKLAYPIRPPKGMSDLPVFNLDQAATDWGTLYKQLGTRKGLKATPLGKQTISGLSCQGYKFSGDIRKLLSSDEVQIPRLPALGNLKGNWDGSYWVSDKLAMPVKMTSNYSGISISWTVSNLKPTDVADTLLQLPPGYRVKEAPEPPAGKS